MENDNINIKDFKDYLESIVNLVTLFGIFNALFIFSGSIDDKDAAVILVPAFFLLSMFIWYQLISYTLNLADISKKIEYFSFLLIFIGIGLVWYFIVKFKPLILLFSVQISLIILTAILSFLIFKITSIILKRKIIFNNDGRNIKLKATIYILSLFISGLILHNYAKHIIQFFDKNIPEIERNEKVEN